MVADLAAARDDVTAFADLAGVPLSDAQADAIRRPVLGDGPAITAILAPRQTGKSQTLALAAAWSAVRGRESRVLVVSAAEDAAKRLLAEVRRMLTGSALAGSVVEETTSLVKLTNGSEVRSVSASERAVRGWTADLLILDEAALLDDALVQGAALPTVAATGGRVLMASSAGPARGTFYDTVTAGDAGARHVRTVRWSLDDAPWIAASTVAAMRESMSELRAKAELDGVFAGGGDLLLGELVGQAVADVRPPGLEGLAGGRARVWAGVDWAASAGGDHSALVALARVPEAGPHRLMVAGLRQWPSGYPLVGERSVIGEIVGGGVPFAVVTAERNGLGEACCQELARRLAEVPVVRGGDPPGAWRDVLGGEPDPAVQVFTRHPALSGPGFRAVYTSQEMKAAVFSALRLMVERGALVIPACYTELIRELRLLRVELTAGGGERIEAMTGHDDLAHALAFALQPRKRRDGRWYVGAARATDPAADPVPARVLGRDVELVSTGGGVELPREPAVQSVDGAEVLVPVTEPMDSERLEAVSGR
jgi:hypothetical protein